MEGLAALAEQLNVTVVPAQTLVGMFSETLSGLSAEKKFYRITFPQRKPDLFFFLSSILFASGNLMPYYFQKIE